MIMKNRFTTYTATVLILAILTVSDVFSQKYTPKYQRDDDKTIQELAERIGEDGWIEFRSDGNSIKASDFLNKYKANLGVGENYELRPLKQGTTSELGLLNQHFQSYYKGLPVEGAYYSLHSRDGKLLIAQGKIILDLEVDVASPVKEGATPLGVVFFMNTASRK